MSAATHPVSSINRTRRTLGWYTGVGLVGAGALLVSACSSDSDDATSASIESAATMETFADTAPATAPLATDPPAEGSAATTTDAPMEGLLLSQTVVAEGTASRVEGSALNGPAGPDGRVATSSRSIYEGDLAGEMILTGSFLAGDDTARDFVSIQNLLGSNGTWVAIGGEVHDASTIVPFLEQFSFIETIERTDRFIEGPDGVAFEMSETFDGGGQGTFWLVVSYDDTGALVITELAEAPQV